MFSRRIRIDPSPAIWKNIFGYFSHRTGITSIKRSAPLFDSSRPTKTTFIFERFTFEGSGLNFSQLMAFGMTKIYFGSSYKRVASCRFVEFETDMKIGFN